MFYVIKYNHVFLITLLSGIYYYSFKQHESGPKEFDSAGSNSEEM